jgi:hypothetical protein
VKNLVYLFATICAAQTCAAQMVYFNEIYPVWGQQAVQCKNIEVDTMNQVYEFFIVTGDQGDRKLIKRSIDFEGVFIEDKIVNYGDTSLYSGVADSFKKINQGYLATYAYSPGGLVELYNDDFERLWRYQIMDTDTSGSYFDISLKTNDGNWLCAGTSILQYDDEIGDDAAPYELCKLDTNGSELWRTQVFAEKNFGVPYCLHELINQDIILTGVQANDYDAVVLRLDSAGNVLWQKTFQSPTEDERDDLWCQSVLVNDSTLVLNYGYGFGDEYPPQPWINSSVRKLHLVKLNLNNQEIMWEQEYDNIYGTFHYNNDMLQSPDNGFVMVGAMYNSSFWPIAEPMVGFQFSYIAKANADGNLLWRRNYTYSPDTSMFVGDWNELYDIELAPDGGYVACGYLNDYDLSPQYQAWVIKVDEYGCLEPGCQNVAVDEIRLDMQGAMSVFPNPVGSVCTVEFNLTDKQKHSASIATELILTDASGRHLQNIALPPLGSQHQLRLDMSEYVSGVYQLHWVSGGAWLDTVQVVKE